MKVIFEIVISSGLIPTQTDNEIVYALIEGKAIEYLTENGFTLSTEATENTASLWVKEEEPSADFDFFFTERVLKNALLFKRNNLIE